MPKISIITISYNNREGLDKTIRSVVSQNFQNFEYLVIDGGSNDGSKEVIKKYEDKINFWVSEPDKGIYNAMNKGILQAKGEYLLFINSGDVLFDEDALRKSAEQFQNADVISGNLCFDDGSKEWVGKSPTEIRFQLFTEGTLWHPCTFIKKSAFETVGLYDENLKICSDWKWFAQAFTNYHCSYQKIEITVSRFFLDGISSVSAELVEKEKQHVLETEFPIFLKDYQDLKSLGNAKTLENNYNQLLKSRIIKIGKKLGFFKNFNPVFLK